MLCHIGLPPSRGSQHDGVLEQVYQYVSPYKLVEKSIGTFKFRTEAQWRPSKTLFLETTPGICMLGWCVTDKKTLSFYVVGNICGDPRVPIFLFTLRIRHLPGMSSAVRSNFSYILVFVQARVGDTCRT